ncbi:MAG: hypothetical protein KC933_41585, partial [Myxococcales bacterium]|nr:hypothetical protein [Myxococcales bacterium]
MHKGTFTIGMSRGVWIGALALGLSACAQGLGEVGEGQGLADLQITDPDFTFATNQSVSLTVQASAGAPERVEVSDAEGRRLMEGAFLGDATVELKVPL